MAANASGGWEAIHIVSDGVLYLFSIRHDWIPNPRFRCERGKTSDFDDLRDIELEAVPQEVIHLLLNGQHRSREDLEEGEIARIVEMAKRELGQQSV